LSFYSKNIYDFTFLKVIARESISADEYYEAAAEFKENDFVCNGKWHSIKVNYEKGSITLRVDDRLPIFALVEPVNIDRMVYPHGNAVTGSLYIGGANGKMENKCKTLRCL